MRQDARPAMPMIDTQGFAGPVACRSGSGLQRPVRHATTSAARRAHRRRFVGQMFDLRLARVTNRRADAYV